MPLLISYVLMEHVSKEDVVNGSLSTHLGKMNTGVVPFEDMHGCHVKYPNPVPLKPSDGSGWAAVL